MVVTKLRQSQAAFAGFFGGVDAKGSQCTWQGYCQTMQQPGTWGGTRELLAACACWNLRIVVLRPGEETVLVGSGDRMVWVQLANQHYEFLRADSVEEHRAARRAH
eukprot:2767713-Lingulodinium_polyedra.AAC.1